MRKLALLPLLALCACGTVCDGVVASEQRQDQNAKNCGLNGITVHDANKCNNNMSKCSQDDMSAMKNYAQCLDNLPMCSSSNKTSYRFSLAGCQIEGATRISFGCSSAIF